ncbi:hypothetical protein V3H56_20120 [Pseudomonas sp. MS646]|uniref:hypothetical protein n=1 Tax=Pseudomonas sp. MS646 TaxID=3118751 RepID=UPI0011873AD9
MNTFRRGFPALFISLLISGSALANDPGTSDSTVESSGVVKVRENDGVRECSIPTTPGDHHVKDYGCTNDQAYTVRFVNVPSALHITFFDNSVHGYCQKDKSWEIEVRTLKNPTTTDDYLNLSAMYGVPDNTLIAPGVLKVRRRDGGPINGRLTCVRVEEGK